MGNVDKVDRTLPLNEMIYYGGTAGIHAVNGVADGDDRPGHEGTSPWNNNSLARNT